MLNDRDCQLNRLLESISDELNISPSMSAKAVSGYKAVGDWLDGCDFDVKIYPQGSFALGTVVKPISDEEEYDIDLVCLLRDGQELGEREIKHIVGDRLKDNGTYSKMLQVEGRRCWTLQYDEFHMDILPCVPNGMHYFESGNTEIRLTNKDEYGIYSSRLSNPQTYKIWFENQMMPVLKDARSKYAIERTAEVEEVQTYEVRTPLQRAVQLLKRYRDIVFENKGDAPISIILTTLAAHAYNNETDLLSALRTIINGMPNYIEEMVDGSTWIKNPAMLGENFADRWNENSSKKDAFFYWHARAQEEILENPLSVVGLDMVAGTLEMSFGERVVRSAMRSIADEDRISRESGKMYMSGLTGGISTSPTNSSKKIPAHTFYGS